MAGAPKKIFISYRRADSQWPADRLKETIAQYVDDPARDIFMDVDNIPLGVNFMEYVDARVRQCDVLLALIGPSWLDARGDGGARRLDDPGDFVRVEIGQALKRGIPVVPVLLDGAAVPAAADLPEDIRELAARNGVEVRRLSFDADAARLVRGLGLTRTAGAPASAPPSQSGRAGWVLPVAAVGVLAVLGAGAYWANEQGLFGGATEEPLMETVEDTAPASGDDHFAAFANSDYSYCDAKVLGALWGQSVGDAKLAIGAKIAAQATDVLDGVLGQAFSAAAAQGRVCSFNETNFTYEDAAVLARVWGLASADAAKTEVENKLQVNGLVGERIVRELLQAQQAQ